MQSLDGHARPIIHTGGGGVDKQLGDVETVDNAVGRQGYARKREDGGK